MYLNDVFGVENVSFECVILRGVSRGESKNSSSGIGLATHGDSVLSRLL